MYCIIQFYVQMRKPLKHHRPFLKVLAIKLVVFLSFWQITAVSIGTNESFKLFEPNHIIAYPDIKISSPAAVLCVEMAFFAILHLWAYPYAPYVPGAKTVYYPSPDERTAKLLPRQESVHQAPSGGTLGIMAFIDAMNPWDIVKAFLRGMRWLLCGVKRRKDDAGMGNGGMTSWDLDNLTNPNDAHLKDARSTEHLPIADQFRRSRFEIDEGPEGAEDGAGLIAHAQPNPTSATADRGMGVSLHPDSASHGYPSTLHQDSMSYGAPSSLHPDSASYGAPSYRPTTAWSSSSPYQDQTSSPYQDQTSGSYNTTRGGERGGEWEPITPRGPPPSDYGHAF
ncbi:OSTA/TMEM184 family protein [Candidatus Bathyarchaeota archaeon]|nr:OSTA/TMEM184 family protein [Candidatus Bathyarchaeota archaeon]